MAAFGAGRVFAIDDSLIVLSPSQAMGAWDHGILSVCIETS
jgi:hypothetical protein